jgi:hypothetical protein
MPPLPLAITLSPLSSYRNLADQQAPPQYAQAPQQQYPAAGMPKTV